MNQSKTYDQLLKESPIFYITRYGTGHILGMEGSDYSIKLAHTLFCNYNKTSMLHWLRPNFAYFTISPEAIRKSIKTFLYVNILHNKEVPSTHIWDEENETFSIIADEKLVEGMSSQDADRFMSSLQIKAFMPSDKATPAIEYSLIK